MKIIRKSQRAAVAAQKDQQKQAVVATEASAAEFPFVSKGLRPLIEILSKSTQTPDIIGKLTGLGVLKGSDASMAKALVKSARLQGLTGDMRKVTHGVKYTEKGSTKTPRYDFVETQAQLANRIASTIRNRLGKLTSTRKGK